MLKLIKPSRCYSEVSKRSFKHKNIVSVKESVVSSSYCESASPDLTSPIHPDLRAPNAATLSLGLIKILRKNRGRDSIDQREIVGPKSYGAHFFSSLSAEYSLVQHVHQDLWG